MPNSHSEPSQSTNASVNAPGKNAGSSESEAWQRLADIVQSGGRTAAGEVDGHFGLKRVYPAPNTSSPTSEPTTVSLLEGLSLDSVGATLEHSGEGKQLHESVSGLLHQLSVFESISRCPILAITGILNAGKSTLLASYLSPENRGRVLRGLGNSAGTHRFVLWLPKIWWDDPELLNTLISYLSSLFGHPPEHLSDDPETAALQYNGRVVASALMHSRNEEAAGESKADEDAIENADPDSTSESRATDPLSVPLIAYDEGLDELRLGLIDCPDIQTGFTSFNASEAHGGELAEQRRQQLAKVGRLCSAFVVLCKMNSLHDDGLLDILGTLRDAMPGVPRLLAVNKVKTRYSPETVFSESRALIDRFGIRSVYAAYDFRSANADTRVPPAPKRMKPSLDGGKLPIFFESTPVSKDSGAAKASSHASREICYLHDLGETLDTGTLSRESSRSLKLQLKAKCSLLLEWLEKNAKLAETRKRDAWQSMADACYDFMAERDPSGNTTGLRLQASPAIVQQMADSLHRTAPTWMRLSLSIDKTARQLHTAIANSAARIKILQSASESVTRFTKRFRRGEGAQVVTPERLSKAIRSCDIHSAFQGVDENHLKAGCELAMQRFSAEDKSKLNDEELDEWSRQVWEGMSWKDKLWKGTQPLAVMTAPLLAAVLVPIDGGGTAVLVFASAKELLAAAGIAAVMTPMATGGETVSIVHRETPWRQLSDLFAILCDSIGLPRPTQSALPETYCQGSQRRLLPSGLESKPPAVGPAIYSWEANQEIVQQFQIALQRLS